jgi:hypothetical protein
MRLFEFDTAKVTVSKIVTLANQLKNDLETGKITPEFTVDELLDYFYMYDVILDRRDLYSMIQTLPMQDVISNIQGDQVIFKGQEQPDSDIDMPADKSKDVVAQMAKSALKK